MDFLWALLFLLWYEALSIPVRVALSDAPAPPDVRRLLSRVAGPALLVLPIWLTAHAGGWVLGRGVALVWLLAALALAARPRATRGFAASALAYRERGKSGGSLARQLRLDVLTAALFFGFVAVRRWMPEMTTYPIDPSGAEKFMNMMIFWSSWHAPALPPEDYWLSGHRLTYYYWGHFHWAWVARVGGFPAESALNLAFARMVTLVFEASYLLARAVGLRMSWSAAAGAMAAWAGNPSAVQELWRVWSSSRAAFDWGAYDFWKPSRAMIESVIDEFPAFSAILGDFHAHHLALPWLVVWLALTVAGRRWLAASPTDASRIQSARFAGPPGWVVLWIGTGLAAAVTNVWNLVPMGFVMALLLLHGLSQGWRRAGAILGLEAAFGLLVWMSVRLILGSHSQPLAVGDSASIWENPPIRWLPAELRSTPRQLFSMWGFPALALAGAALVRGLSSRGVATVLTLSGWSIALATWTGLGASPGAALWIWVAVSCWILSLASGRRPWLPRRAAWMLLAVCTILAGLELVFVDDAMTGEYERYNSYFKLSYPLWPVFTVGAFAASRRAWHLRVDTRGARPVVWAVRLGLVGVLAAAMVYPVAAIPARLIAARRGDDPPRQPTLNAVDFLAHRPPYDEEAPMLAWIRDHVPRGETVAEGRGQHAYGYVGRVASLAGRPVPLGWAHHEGQWRGRSGHELAANRARAIDRLYQADSPEAMRRAASELGAKWVLHGLVERERYGGTRAEGVVLQQLEQAAPLAVAFPGVEPTVFLFDFRKTDDR